MIHSTISLEYRFLIEIIQCIKLSITYRLYNYHIYYIVDKDIVEK